MDISYNLKELLAISREVNIKNFGKKINFYIPSFSVSERNQLGETKNKFISISITGEKCYLNCKHCCSLLLRTMEHAINAKELFQICLGLKEKGCNGILISGGCMPDGSIPIERFIKTIKRIKDELNFKIFVHTGMIDNKTARMLKDSGVDLALIDIIGSEDTVKEVCGSDLKFENYEKSLSALTQSGIPFVPHIILGLHYGQIKGEYSALKMISKYRPNALVIIALIPIKGTPMEKVSPPKPEEIAQFISNARLLMPEIPITLGCMRPKGRHRNLTDMLALLAGVNGIAFPQKKCIDLAETLGFEISFSPICCSQAYLDFLGKKN